MNAEFMAKQNEILRVVNGSELYGTNIGTSDRDEIGICIPGPEWYIGFKNFEQYEFSTGSGNSRNTADDFDLTIYSLKKFAKLVADGNPSMVNLLFVPEDKIISSSKWGSEILSIKSYIHSKEGVKRFLGYMTAQIKRLNGESKSHTPNRPELVEKYGYDTKFAGHAVRLGLQGIEFAQYGRITLPMPDAQLIKDIRNGEFSLETVIDLCNKFITQLEMWLDHPNLPSKPNYKAVEQKVIELTKDFWHTRGLL